ncbi:hypothetical protein EJ06DRAFT_532387 [Trichodelitschia bisporula]|uniref:MARVEL domain-containing protein n=1 Tax=Trichodelitschia bisporula TaxID=703511 RepID=A0A6G1HQ42_9PEZI|nr:hypothetical protein EJ06DRAFT_532387 [Trichodelitschia bisporula]
MTATTPANTNTAMVNRFNHDVQMAASDSRFGLFGVIVRMFLRFFQIIMAVTVIGLYTVDIARARQLGASADPAWIFAVSLASASAALAIFCFWPVKAFIWFLVDLIFMLLWLIVFGLFAAIYRTAKDQKVTKPGWHKPMEGPSLIRMKHAVWVDMVNAVLWFITGVWGAIQFWRNRKLARAGINAYED